MFLPVLVRLCVRNVGTIVRPSCWLSLAGNIASWKKKEGEQVGAGDEMAEIETDKVCCLNGLPGFRWVLSSANGWHHGVGCYL